MPIFVCIPHLGEWEFGLNSSRQNISIVTCMEVMCGADLGVVDTTRAFLSRFTVIPIEPAIAERAVDLRRTRNLKLPDAIIWATALEGGLLLVTRNTKDFDGKHPSVRCPYRV